MRILLFIAALATVTAHAVSPYRGSSAAAEEAACRARCASSEAGAPNLRNIDGHPRTLSPMEQEFLKVLGAIGIYVVVMAGGIMAARALSRRRGPDEER